MAKQVQEVITELVEANYVGDISGLAVAFVNGLGEIEIKVGFTQEHVYKIIAAIDVLKFELLQDIVKNAATKPRDRN